MLMPETLQTQLLANYLLIVSKSLKVFAPPPQLKVSEFAEKNMYLSAEASAAPGLYKSSRAPYQKAMLDAINESGVETAVIMTSAQVGKTTIVLAVLSYYIANDPSPILCIQPTLDMGKTFSKDRVSPMLRDSPTVGKSVGKSSSLLHKQFHGGHLTIAGSNSPSSLASRPIRILLADEIDRYPPSAGKEGDPLNLAKKRTTTYYNRKHIFVSTPGLKYVEGEGGSRIEKAFLDSDQRHYLIPCPHCDYYQTLIWENLKWEQTEAGEHLPETVKYQCRECKKLISENHKMDMLTRGEWRASKPSKKIVGFHLNEIYSPWKAWAEIISDFLECRHDIEMYKVWVNTSLGLSYQYKGDDVPDWRSLYHRRENYKLGTVPKKASLLTCGVDVQKNRLEATIVAYSRNESFVVDHVILEGDPLEDQVWDDLDRLIDRDFKHESGNRLKIRRVAIDTGYLSNRIYEWIRRKESRLVMGVKGRPLDAPISTPKSLDVTLRGKIIKKGVRLWGMGSSYLKSEIYGKLRLKTPTSKEIKGKGYPKGYVHFPELDEEFFKQLTSEACIGIKLPTGHIKYEWHKTYPNNEVLDNMAMALAAYYSIGANKWSAKEWSEREEALIPDDQPKKVKPKKKRKYSNFWKK